MTKKKVVVKVSMNGRAPKFSLFPNFRRQDNRLKALQIAVAVPGFQSLTLKGADRDVIEVTADGVDAAKLTMKLRKSVGYADLETVTEVKEGKEQEQKKPKKDEPPKPAEPPVVWTCGPYFVTEPQSACCTIM